MLYIVKVRVGASDLISRMSEMRQWLDRQRYEPDLFHYRMEAHGALVRVEFKHENEALAFADALDGRIPR